MFSDESEREWLTGSSRTACARIVDGTVADVPARRLVTADGRRALAARLRREIRSTGLPVESVLIPDLAVS